MDKIRKHWLAASAGAIALWGSPALAQTTATEGEMAEDVLDASAVRRNATYVDLTGSLGYSTNPLMRTGDSQSSVFGRGSARGVHMWNSELSSTSLSGFVEGTTYFNEYGVKSIFSLSGDTQRQVSETVRLFGSAGVSGDLAGQLSNRFLYVPPLPEVPVEGAPPPVTVDDPDSFSSRRQYRVYGQGGASIRTSERGSLSVSGGAQRIFYTDESLDDYTSIFGNGAYSHSLSDRTTVGFNVGVRRTDYDNSSDHTTIINPGISIRTRLSESWDASAGVGVSFSDVERDGEGNSSTSLSFNGALCKSTENDRFCGRASRYANSTSRSALVTTTSFGVDWFRKLDEAQTVQLSASVSRYVDDDEFDDELDNNSKTNHYRLAGSYSRRINGRLSAGADLGLRALREEGPDPDTDVSGSLFVRYRLGDLG